MRVWPFASLAIPVAAALSREGKEQLLPWPTRELEWGDINVISTSDVHGWLLGHQHDDWPEPNYSGDFGDYASFATHMRTIAESKGVDLLLVDAGDHHDGTGIVSISRDSAKRTEEIFSKLPYDIMTIGNHELYNYPVARAVYDAIDQWEGAFITSNVNITVEDSRGGLMSVPIGQQYKKLRTNTGRNVTAFGVIYSFEWSAANLTVQPPSGMIAEDWFQNAIEDEPDYFVLAGHMPVRGGESEFRVVFNAIRLRHPSVPILVYGGHSHVRDCTQYDERSIAVVPGRYMETIAFTSVNTSDPDKHIFTRRYLDANRRSYKYHTGHQHDFDTDLGRNISASLLDLAVEMDIQAPLGIAPHNYYLQRYPLGHPSNIQTFASQHVFPAIVIDPSRKHNERIVLVNGQTFRFDIFAGTFNRNDELTVCPFPNKFVYASLPAGLARNLTDQMNRDGTTKMMPDHPRSLYEADRAVEVTYDVWLQQQAERWSDQQGRTGPQVPFVPSAPKLTLGYVTHDACPGAGDDVEHIPPIVSRNARPDFVSSPFPPDLLDTDMIDVVITDFALDDLLVAANILDPERKLQKGDFEVYAPNLTLNNILGEYAKRYW